MEPVGPHEKTVRKLKAGRYAKYGFLCGLLWGLPIPCFMLFIDLSARDVLWSWEEVIQTLNQRPIHWVFLFHPALFALIFFSIGMMFDYFVRRTEEVVKHLEFEARTDGLTRLLNHTTFYEKLHHEMNRFYRLADRNPEFTHLSLVMLDIDYFKNINDAYGHQIGDEMLRRFANILQNSIRTYDYACRYGGDEFSLILPETDREEAKTIASRILEQVRDVLHLEGQPLHVSIGIATLRGRDNHKVDASALVSSADKAMYRAKEKGGNNIVEHPVSDLLV